MTLALAGYRFGESNHAVYLVDALRRNDPALLANDWWVRSTLQYHFVFSRLSAWLMRVGWIEPAFLAGYLGLTVLLHVAWRRLTHALGGCDGAYLASVIVFQLMAAGTGLGMYQFLQDSSFLPSNIANVAMLWGVYCWVRRRAAWSGLWFGLAGLFHLNHALAGIGLWTGLTLLAAIRERAKTGMLPPPQGKSLEARALDNSAGRDPTRSRERSVGSAGAWIAGTLLLLSLSAPAIAPAVKAVLGRTASMPLAEFVALYVRLRHPHHYDPSSWPPALWATFLIPIALAVLAYRTAMREMPTDARRRAADAFALFLAMLSIALLGAGLWYVSEPLIQMSLYRFSIFPKLLSCIAVGWMIRRSAPSRLALRVIVIGMFVAFSALMLGPNAFGHLLERVPPFVATNAFAMWLFALFATVAVLRARVTGRGRMLFGGLAAAWVVASLVMSWPKLGIVHAGLRGDDASYLAVCDWALHNTPRDAVFLVPPDEQSFRLHARRAIVVNFKNVPQLSSELGEWRDRLQTVLDTDRLTSLPTPFPQTLDAMRSLYEKQSPERLAAIARGYGARYVVSVHRLDARAVGEPVFYTPDARYFLYDLGAP